MRVDYKPPLQVTVRSLRHYHQIETQVEETRGTDFFPEAEISGETGYVLRFNPKVQAILALYNLAMSRGCDTGEAVVRYVLFHAALETDRYDLARVHLDGFREEVARLGLAGLPDDVREEAGARLLLQLYFILFHESFHIILHHHPDERRAALETTRKLLLDIKAEWEDGLSLVSEEELLNHPKTTVRQQALSRIHRQSPAGRPHPGGGNHLRPPGVVEPAAHPPGRRSHGPRHPSSPPLAVHRLQRHGLQQGSANAVHPVLPRA